MTGPNRKGPVHFKMLKSLNTFFDHRGIKLEIKKKERKREALKYLETKQYASKLPMDKRRKSQAKFLNILKWMKMKTQPIKICARS